MDQDSDINISTPAPVNLIRIEAFRLTNYVYPSPCYYEKYAARARRCLIVPSAAASRMLVLLL